MSEITEKVKKIRIPAPRYPVIKQIAARFSPRYFSEEQIPEEHLNSIFEAARLAPSGRNSQPWYFYWTRKGSEAFNNIHETLVERNKWAKTAPVYIVCTYTDRNEKGENEFALYDLGAAVLSLVLQATDLGYYARQLGLFDQDALGKIVQVKEHETPFIVVALGKIGDYKDASEDLIQKDLTTAVRKEDIVKEI